MLGPFATASRRTPIHQVSLPVLSHAACASMSTTTTTTTTTTTRNRGDRYGPIELAQKVITVRTCISVVRNDAIEYVTYLENGLFKFRSRADKMQDELPGSSAERRSVRRRKWVTRGRVEWLQRDLSSAPRAEPTRAVASVAYRDSHNQDALSSHSTTPTSSRGSSRGCRRGNQAAFHDTDILADILARRVGRVGEDPREKSVSVSASWNASFTTQTAQQMHKLHARLDYNGSLV